MAKPSRTGVRGLFKEVRYFAADGTKLRKVDAEARKKAGEKVRKEERYYVDHRWRDPKTGKPDRYTERLAPDISAGAAKTRAMEIINGTTAGTFERKPEAARTIAAALDEYDAWAKVNRPRTYSSRKSLTGIIKDKLGHLRIDAIVGLDVERFKRARLRELIGKDEYDEEEVQKHAATVNRAVAQLKHLYTLMEEEWKWVSKAQKAEVHDVKKLSEPAGRVRYLKGDEEGKLFGTLKGTLKLLVEAANLTGMRRSEVVLLRKDAVDLEHGKIVLRKTKANRVREVLISDALRAVLTTALACSPEASPYVFTQQKGKHRGQPYRPGSASQGFRRARKAAGIEDLKLHDIRHDAASKMRRAGHGLDVIKEVLGHSNISITNRYAHVGTDQLRAAMNSIPAPVGVPVAKPLPDDRIAKIAKRAKLRAV